MLEPIFPSLFFICLPESSTVFKIALFVSLFSISICLWLNLAESLAFMEDIFVCLPSDFFKSLSMSSFLTKSFSLPVLIA